MLNKANLKNIFVSPYPNLFLWYGSVGRKIIFFNFSNSISIKESAVAWWLMPRSPDPEVGGSSPTRVKPCCVLEQGTFSRQKVLVNPRKRWLRPNMTEKLFTGTLRINQPTNQPYPLNLIVNRPNIGNKTKCTNDAN